MQARRVLRRLLVTTILAPIFTPLVAQTAASKIAGTWSGYIGRSEATPAAATVNFKITANGALAGSVTGPQLEPGEIKTGSYDPTTGALKFTVVIKSATSGEGGQVEFDGTVARDTAQGKMLLAGQTGVFKFTRGTAGKTTQTLSSKDSEGAAAARRGFVEVSDWITRAAELVPADKYSYRPTSTVRTFGQLVGHVVDGSRYYCSRGAGRNVEWTDATEKGVTAKAALLQALKQAVADCTKAHDGASLIGPLMANVAHNSLHYGNMITYIRILGLVPPSS